jgi:hypothetical protein
MSRNNFSYFLTFSLLFFKGTILKEFCSFLMRKKLDLLMSKEWAGMHELRDHTFHWCAPKCVSLGWPWHYSSAPPSSGMDGCLPRVCVNKIVLICVIYWAPPQLSTQCSAPPVLCSLNPLHMKQGPWWPLFYRGGHWDLGRKLKPGLKSSLTGFPTFSSNV